MLSEVKKLKLSVNRVLGALSFFPAAFFFFALYLPSSARATECYSSRYFDVRIGQIIEQEVKVKVGAVCTSGYTGGSLTWLGVDFLDYPKGIFRHVSNAYEIAYSISKPGKYIVKLRRRARGLNNNEGYINYIWNIEAVTIEW